jgi:outer membrane receptor protein involved in Fe transport
MKRRLFGEVSILIAAAFAGPAFAQTVEDEVEVVVTARKTTEQLSDVPLAANVLGAEQLETLVLDKLEDYLRQSPSTILVNGGPEYLADISIRGQGGGRQGFSESATGVYRNGIYVAGGGFGGRGFNALDLFDTTRIEVLRGPQGALYGRNAVGGAINVVSKRPNLDGFELTGSAGYDDRERTTLRGTLNVPVLQDTLAVRLAATGYDQTDGFYTDLSTGRAVDEQDFLGARASVLYQLNDAWSVTLTGESSQSTAPGFSALGKRVDVPNRAERLDPSVFQRNASRVGGVVIEEDTGFLEVEGDLGFAELTVVGAYRHRVGFRSNDDLDHFLGFEDVNSGGVVTDLLVSQREVFERSGVEVRLASPSNSGGPFRWLIGVDYQRSDSDVRTINEGVTNVAAIRELATRSEFFEEDLASSSVFGLLEWAATDRWTLTVEARQQSDEKDFRYERVDRAPTPTNTSLGPAVDQLESDKFSPTLSARYRLSDDAILYARIASAFRPGGFNTGTINPGFISYEPETAAGGEVGWKGRMFGRVQASAAAYYTETEDLQLVTAISATDTTTALVNVPGAYVWGLELEASTSFDVGAGRLSVQGSLSHADGEFNNGSTLVSQGVLYDVSGQRVNRARDLAAVLNLRYDRPITDALRGFALLSGTAETGGYENAIGALGVVGQSRSLDDFSKLSARLGVNASNWRASVYVQNITDDVELLQTVLGNEYFGSPRVIGAEVSVRFGN